jgi:5-methylcytosine-specific restriction endonuclease McrA
MELRALACDCSLSRIVFGPDGEIIDVGRRTRVIPSATRRAVIARDHHCTWDGCDRDPRWCDVHHIISWANGGETEPGNLRLLCRYHHTLTHLLEDQDRAPPLQT